MSSVVAIEHRGWHDPATSAAGRRAVEALERGDLLFLPQLAFRIEPDERQLFSPAILGTRKNVSFDPQSGRLRGTSLDPGELRPLATMMGRFSEAAAGLVDSLLEPYTGRLERGRCSFRPAEIAGRHSSWRQDDTRLHVDSFQATPVQARRILRVFSNVNPSGRARTWRIGGSFEVTAQRFADRLSLPLPGSALLLQLLRVTKSRRTPYDALMLQLHDRMKGDDEYQHSTPQQLVDFPSGTTWIAFTDQVSHAAMAGQFQLEQTFYLPVGAMVDESRSPLRILERLKGRRLVV